MSAKWPLFARLYSREMERVGIESLGLAGVSLVIILLSITPWSRNYIIAPLFIVVSIAMFLPLLTSLLSLHREWRENTIYMIMSLPVGGAAVLSAKLSAALTQLLLNGIIVLITGIISGLQFVPKAGIDWGELWGQLQVTWQQAPGREIIPFLIILGFLAVVYVICSLQLGLLLGKLFRRFTTLATIGGIIAVFWLTSNLYSGLIKLMFDQIHWQPGMAVPALELTVLSAVMAAVIALIFTGAVYVYNHRIEV